MCRQMECDCLNLKKNPFRPTHEELQGAISSQADGHRAEGHRGAVKTEHLKEEVTKRFFEPLLQQARWASRGPIWSAVTEKGRPR